VLRRNTTTSPNWKKRSRCTARIWPV
jgi:hypothetical protein